MNLPPEFVANIRNGFGARGEAWLASLPDQIAAAAINWQLTLHPPYDCLSYGYVAPVECADGTPAVLKLGVPDPELIRGIQALGYFNPRRIVSLLKSDPGKGIQLLERLVPGEMLITLTDDDQATRIAAELMRDLWQPLPENHPFPSIGDWAAALKKIIHLYPAGGPIPHAWIDKAEGLYAELLPSQADPVVLHGDLHHYNILSSGDGWKAIDPQGVIGEPIYETGAFLRNPLDLTDHPDPLGLTERRIAILSEMLGFDRRRILMWAIAQSVLSDWWSVEGAGSLNASDFFYYEMLNRIKL